MTVLKECYKNLKVDVSLSSGFPREWVMLETQPGAPRPRGVTEYVTQCSLRARSSLVESHLISAKK